MELSDNELEQLYIDLNFAYNRLAWAIASHQPAATVNGCQQAVEAVATRFQDSGYQVNIDFGVYQEGG